MNDVVFWLDNFRSIITITIIYIIKVNLSKKSERRLSAHLRKIEKENLILHQRLEKILKGEK